MLAPILHPDGPIPCCGASARYQGVVAGPLPRTCLVLFDCQRCGQRLAEVIPLGPLVPSVGRCWSCEGPRLPDGCESCGLAHSELESVETFVRGSPDRITAASRLLEEGYFRSALALLSCAVALDPSDVLSSSLRGAVMAQLAGSARAASPRAEGLEVRRAVQTLRASQRLVLDVVGARHDWVDTGLCPVALGGRGLDIRWVGRLLGEVSGVAPSLRLRVVADAERGSEPRYVFPSESAGDEIPPGREIELAPAGSCVLPQIRGRVEVRLAGAHPELSGALRVTFELQRVAADDTVVHARAIDHWESAESERYPELPELL